MKISSLLVLWSASALIIGCESARYPENHIFNPSKLPTQTFTIDIEKTTRLKTLNGATILIPAGSIEAGDKKKIRLEVKEAYSMEEIVRAGLYTVSNGEALSSGGMIWLHPATEGAIIKKQFHVSIPTPFIEPGMTAYTGKEYNNGKINWLRSKDTLLSVLPGDSNNYRARLNAGKSLFINNCATCHGIQKDLTGPALAHISGFMKKMDPQHPALLYAYTRHNNQVLTQNNIYYNHLFLEWNKTPMNIFPAITDEELDVLYDYIENESKRLNLPERQPDCLDSCFWGLMKAGYRAAQLNTNGENTLTIYHPRNTIRSSVNENALTNGSLLSTAIDTIPPAYILPIYQWGWHNVDQLTQDIAGLRNIHVYAKVEGLPSGYTATAELIIPGLRIYFPAEMDKDGVFDFSKLSPLKAVPGQEAFILVTAGTDKELYAGNIKFSVRNEQTLSIRLQPSTPEKLEQFLTRISGNKKKAFTNEDAFWDIDTATTTNSTVKKYRNTRIIWEINHPKDSILCKCIEGIHRL